MTTLKKETKTLIETATETCEVTKTLKEIIMNGWPNKKEEIPMQLRQYY